MSRVRVYMACSLDGYIAGPGDDLGFLTEGAPDVPNEAEPTGALGFEQFMGQVGSMLMGRRTHDVVAGFGQWAYGHTPVLVATSRPLPEPAAPTVRPVQGDITFLVEQAKAVANGKDVYLDGGALIRQALDAGLVDELCITWVPVLLGDGIRLFDGLQVRSRFRFVAHHAYQPGMVQVTLVPRDA